ncbi:DUF6572 domain-containing protein [Caballeronia glebae]|nr:DUF6572 domain-containing protein [Caballeronia glebae]
MPDRAQGSTMSLRDVDVIDYIGVNFLFQRVYVGLFDELDWSDEREHRALLSKKIDRYVRYIRSGKLLLSYPHVRGYEIVFEYVSMRPMTPSGLAYWKSRERMLAEAGYEAHIRGVDVRHSLGIAVEQPEQVETEPVEPAEPPALEASPAENRPVNVADIAYLPPSKPASRKAHALPAVKRLSIRPAAG